MMGGIVVLGIFVADATFRGTRLPKMGETVLGTGFALGPGGKGSNQAVAAGRLGGDVTFLTRLGVDAFADLGRKTWDGAGVRAEVIETPESYTGAASIFIDEATGDNAIIVSPGAARLITPQDMEAKQKLIEGAGWFLTQLEQPLEAALRGLEIAKSAGVTTILNPAPADDLPEGMLALCDYVTPNESEAEALTGLPVSSVKDAERAASALIGKGAGAAIITLGAQGALLHDGKTATHVAAFDAGTVMETTGAGDAFNGGFAVALQRGMVPVEAVRFGCAVASISVTRAGAAAAMPSLEEVQSLLAKG